MGEVVLGVYCLGRSRVEEKERTKGLAGALFMRAPGRLSLAIQTRQGVLYDADLRDSWGQLCLGCYSGA